MLTISNLCFDIGNTPILTGVNFTVAEGEQLGIIGPNGSGKTTLFNCISGFNLPQKGSITFRNQDVTELAPHARAALGVGRVFQNFGIFRGLTLLENVLLAVESKQSGILLPWSKKHKANVATAMGYLDSVGLSVKSDIKAGSLSGGQMRLLEITRTLAFGAQLFLLDEPTAGVSPKMKCEVEAVLEKLRGLKKTVLIIEHDINFIQKLCDRILVLDIGRVILDDTPERVRSNPQLQDIYFGSSNGNAAPIKY